ncbi:MAG: MaoC family dehydratase [Actinomycetota bacterium]|nr:MaoC family dehydratase [Actinomycetota bacterium]
MNDGQVIRVEGPYFEDLRLGRVYDDAPGLTLTSGHAALHQAIAGDRMRLALDEPLSRQVTGGDRILAHPNLVCDIAIGQSTGPTQRVLGNLFYRGMILLRPVFIGDTLRTRTEIVALKQNRKRGGGTATGLAALRMRTDNQDGEPVLDFWRCPMLPLRDPEAETGHADAMSEISAELDEERLAAAIPRDWRFEALRERAGSARDLDPGSVIELDGRETVTAAPELARLILNLAKTHTDAGSGARGRRLVYGGQTIAIAAAHATRALPSLATIVAWRSCEHSAPVFEGDILSTVVTIVTKAEIDGTDADLVELRAMVEADRGAGDPDEQVLDWTFLAVLA